MIQLKPDTENSFVCPECYAPGPKVNDVLIQSMHVLADCTCHACGFAFYQTFPVSHTTDVSISVGKPNLKLYAPNGDFSWLAQTLASESRKEEISIRKKVFKVCEEVVVLNALDFLYGHVLLKLYNSIYHLDHSGPGLVVIVPRALEWLVPQGCAEVWVVDLRLNDLVNRYEALGRFVNQELQRFRKVSLSKAWSHPDVAGVDIKRLTSVAPFDLEEFCTTRPMITFVLREDRWWLPAELPHTLFRMLRKLGLKDTGTKFMNYLQDQLVRKTIHEIRKILPEVSFVVVGLGTPGSLADVANDERTTKISNETELRWCHCYASSHVVIGIHGSNMLLPTALAAACVEILPEDRFGNMVQDISVRYNDRKQLFMYRFADQYSRALSVAQKAASIIRDFPVYNRNMCRNLYE